MPGFTEEVERPGTIRYRYQDLMGAYMRRMRTDFSLSASSTRSINSTVSSGLKRLSRLKRERLTKKWEKQNA